MNDLVKSNNKYKFYIKTSRKIQEYNNEISNIDRNV